MKGIKKIALALGFTRKRSEFELLETEKGAPSFLGGWRYAEEQKQEEKPEEKPDASSGEESNESTSESETDEE